MKYNKIVRYLMFLLPWFISSIIFRVDTNYYNNLNLPVFAPPSILFPIVWTLLYVLISIALYIVYDNSSGNYKKLLFVNYLSNQLYTLFFFIIKSNFLALADALVVFVSSIFLYWETKKYSDKASYLLVLYVLWNLFATILSISILFLN